MKLTHNQVVDADLAHNHPDQNPTQAKIALANELHNPGGRQFRFGDTIFVVRNTYNSTAKFHAINAAKATDFVGNLKKFFDAMKHLKYKLITTEVNNKKIIDVARKTGADISFVQTKDEKGSPQFNVKVRL